MSSAETTMTTTPVTGSFHDLARTEARKSTAMATAMAARIALAGMTALTSV